MFLVAVILVSGAFAYLTDTDNKTNTFTMGSVNIELTEPNWNPTNGEDLWAGKVMPKDPTVKNVGINDAYVYMMVEVPKASSLKIVGDDNTASLKENYPLFEYAVNEGWTLIDSETGIEDEAYDYYLYAYDTTLAKDESATLFNSVTFANITEDFAAALAELENPELDITVTAYAIQSTLANATDAEAAWDFYANQNGWDWPTRPYEGTLADLESKHKFKYYSSFRLAVNDVNNGEIGVNADVNRPDAVAGIYTEEGEAPTVVLFKDAEETGKVDLAADMNINLAGNTLTLKETDAGLNTKNNGCHIYIDGRIEGSTIANTSTGTQAARCLQVLYNDSVIIENVTLIAKSESGTSNCAVVGGQLCVEDCVLTSESNSGSMSVLTDVGAATNGNIEVLNCTITGFSNSGMSVGIMTNGSTVLNVDNSTINASSNSNSVNGFQIGYSDKYPNATPMATIRNSNIYTNSGSQSYGILVDGSHTKLNISNSTVLSDSPYKDSPDKSYRCAGIDIDNQATAIIKNCNVKGVHSAIQNKGTLYIDGGTYQGWGHGGIYFGNSGKNAYVKNANVGQWDYDGEYDTSAMSVNNGAAMYIGGGSNINVYMDNCNLTALRQVIVLRQGSGEQNNTLHISNSTINTHDIRIDNTTHKLYIGKGCNFDVNSVASNKSVVTQTDEVYTFDMPN